MATQRVGYTDKVAVDPKPNTPNYWVDANANEVKSVVNNNADEIDNNSANISTNSSNISTNANDLSNHEADNTNPHSVTAAQVGLGNVDNTSDANKPISTATQTALDAITDITTGIALYNATTTGTVTLDCSTFDSWYRILTGNTDFQFSNTPASGLTFVRNLEVITTAGESLTFTTADSVIGTFVNDNTTVNLITINFANYPTLGLRVTVVIS